MSSFRAAAVCLSVLLLTACPRAADPAICPDAGPVVDCSEAGACGALEVTGDAPATTPGTFKGFSDPTLAADPDVEGRVWLAYTWPHIRQGQALDGGTVSMAAASLHLARSDDSGASFTSRGELFPEVPIEDPEGSGQNGLLSSEVASLVSMQTDTGTVWFGSRQYYFLQAETGYHPRYATAWMMRIASAASPEQLAGAPDTLLGVSTAAPVYPVNVFIDQLAGLPIQRCALLNNPALFVEAQTLYLIVECLAFSGSVHDPPNDSVQVYATNPSGQPSGWAWRHLGPIAGPSVARELGAASVKQPDLSRAAADGAPILILTYAALDATTVDGTQALGCAALELESLEPPVLRRDCDGHLVVRAKLDGARFGACAHAAGSITGIVATSYAPEGGFWTLRASGLRP